MRSCQHCKALLNLAFPEHWGFIEVRPQQDINWKVRGHHHSALSLPRSGLQLHYCCGIEHCITVSTKNGYLLLRADLGSIHQPCRYHRLAASRVNQHLHRSTIQVAPPKVLSTPLVPSHLVAALGIQGLAGSRSGWRIPAWTVEHEMPVLPALKASPFTFRVCLCPSLHHGSPGLERGLTRVCSAPRGACCRWVCHL